MAQPSHRRQQRGVAREDGADQKGIKHAVALGAAIEDLATFGVHACYRPLSIGQIDDLSGACMFRTSCTRYFTHAIAHAHQNTNHTRIKQPIAQMH